MTSKKKAPTKKAAKKRAPKKSTGKPPAKPFAKGNTVGKQFQPGNPGGPGRPPLLKSPRERLKHYVEQLAPERVREMIQDLDPSIDVSELPWADVVALMLLSKSVEGDMNAIAQVIKNVDDRGLGSRASSPNTRWSCRSYCLLVLSRLYAYSMHVTVSTWIIRIEIKTTGLLVL